jgi:hypothetical protein
MLLPWAIPNAEDKDSVPALAASIASRANNQAVPQAFPWECGQKCRGSGYWIFHLQK